MNASGGFLRAIPVAVSETNDCETPLSLRPSSSEPQGCLKRFVTDAQWTGGIRLIRPHRVVSNGGSILGDTLRKFRPLKRPSKP